MTLEELIELAAVALWKRATFEGHLGEDFFKASEEARANMREMAWKNILRSAGVSEEDEGLQIREKVFAPPETDAASKPLPRRALRLAKGGLRC